MAVFRRGALFVPPALQCRHGSKVHIKRPKTFYERLVFEAITKPVTPEMLEPEKKQCIPRAEFYKKHEEQNLFEEFLIRRCREVFEQNSMIVVCQPWALPKMERTAIRNKLWHSGIEMIHYYGNQIVLKTIKDTKWANLAPLFTCFNYLCVSPENRLQDLIKITKKTPQLMILGGIVEDRMLTRDALMRYAAIPDIDHVRAELSATLSQSVAKTHSLLNSHQQTLSTNLAQYIKDSSDPGTS